MDRDQMLKMLRDATLEPYQLGLSFDRPMIPPIPERCVPIPAGPLRFVVEARHLDDQALAATLSSDETEGDGALFDDYGPTLHVYGTEDGSEHLRFDCFANKPHYHYVQNGGAVNTICRIDQHAEGDPVEWTLGRLRARLPEMLDYCGLPDLADQVRAEQAVIDATIDDVAELLREARRRALDERVSA
jgi:hypothetical protein